MQKLKVGGIVPVHEWNILMEKFLHIIKRVIVANSFGQVSFYRNFLFPKEIGRVKDEKLVVQQCKKFDCCNNTFSFSFFFIFQLELQCDQVDQNQNDRQVFDSFKILKLTILKKLI